MAVELLFGIRISQSFHFTLSSVADGNLVRAADCCEPQFQFVHLTATAF